MFGLFKKKEKPINIERLAMDHTMVALNAMCQEEPELEKGTVVSRHMPYIKMQHLFMSQFLGSMIDANERAQKE